MKVEVYGKPYDQACQDAVSFLKSAKINVKFFNTDLEEVRNNLVETTKEMQKSAEYSFKSTKNGPVPIVVSPDTKEVIVGYSMEDGMYDNILKEAKNKELNNFISKYPEWKRKTG